MYNGASYSGQAYGGGSSSYALSTPNASYATPWYQAQSLETTVNHAMAEKPVETVTTHYTPNSAKNTYLSAAQNPHDYFTVDNFLAPGSTAKFIGDAEEIKKYVKEAFKATTGNELPNDIAITVLPDKKFRAAHIAHNGDWCEGVQGFSLNTNGKGVNKIFVRANPLDRLMLTVGHEIGHVLTQSLANAHDEEAKAFAFSFAWMNTIREKNIADLKQNILPEPANNGLHDKAFAFVQNVMNKGVNAWDAFLQLARGTLTIREQPIILEA